MKVIRITLLALVVLYGFNVLTQSLFGKQQLAKRLVKDSHISFRQYQWTKDVYIFFDLAFSQNDEKQLLSLYKGTIAEVKPTKIDSPEDYSDYFSKKDVYNHILLFETDTFLPLREVTEAEKIEEYGQIWKMKYLWILIDWIQLENENKGIS